jgi:DNA-directed RNA polymerase specialized sigma24 family protein
VKEQERQKRHPGKGGSPAPGSAETLLGLPGVEQIADRRPPPDLEVLANETIEHLLRRLDNPQLRSIAVWKWEGYSNEEIADKLHCVLRTVERRLQLIRRIWEAEIPS